MSFPIVLSEPTYHALKAIYITGATHNEEVRCGAGSNPLETHQDSNEAVAALPME